VRRTRKNALPPIDTHDGGSPLTEGRTGQSNFLGKTLEGRRIPGTWPLRVVQVRCKEH